jgi:hypothetical protein
MIYCINTGHKRPKRRAAACSNELNLNGIMVTKCLTPLIKPTHNTKGAFIAVLRIAW